MNCPHCQRQLPDPSVATCPFCGMPVRAATGQDPYAGPTVIQGAPGGDPAQTAWSPAPGASSGEQPTLLYGQQQPGGQPPAYTPPGYTPQPQPPVYGQPQQPAYGATPQPWAGQAQPQPPKKSRAGLVVGCLVAL